MLCRAAILILTILTAVRGFADYVSERDAAMRQVWDGKHEEALAAFLRMAEGAKSDVQKSDALEQAVQCALALKRYEQAAAIARRIPIAPVAKTCQMRIMAANRRWDDLVAAFMNENIDDWPEDVKGDAFHLRGSAFYHLKNGARAEADLKKACEYLYEENSLGLALNLLGDTYQHLLKQDSQAIETYRRAYKVPALYKQCQAAIAIAEMLKRQGRLAEALVELAKMDMAKVTVSYWRAALLAARADVLARQGKRNEAIAHYNEALRLPDIHPAQKSAYEKALAELQVGQK